MRSFISVTTVLRKSCSIQSAIGFSLRDCAPLIDPAVERCLSLRPALKTRSTLAKNEIPAVDRNYTLQDFHRLLAERDNVGIAVFCAGSGQLHLPFIEIDFRPNKIGNLVAALSREDKELDDPSIIGVLAGMPNITELGIR